MSAADRRLLPDADRGTNRLPIPADAEEPQPTAITTMPSESLIGIREIRAMFRLGRTAAYELTHRPGFPAPVRISARCYRWWATEVTAFAAGLRQETRPASRERSTRRTTASLDIAPLRITGRVRPARRPKKTP